MKELDRALDVLAEEAWGRLPAESNYIFKAQSIKAIRSAIDQALALSREKWEAVSDYERPPNGYIQIPDNVIGVLKYRHQGQYGDDRQLMKLTLPDLAALSVGQQETMEEEAIPPFKPTQRCPVCWTFGHEHRKDCVNRDAGMTKHIRIDPKRQL